MIDEDWSVVMSLLPLDWWERGVRTKALKGLRKDKSAEALLRTLLIHLAGGYSLRETALRARQADLAAMSDVALLKRLRKSKDWLAALCVALFRERGVGNAVVAEAGARVRLVDATSVKEPGPTGSVWRLHYSVQLPSLVCDYLKVTPSQGEGNGESLRQYPIRAGDYLIGDRGYGSRAGVQYVTEREAYLMVRMTPPNLPLWDAGGHLLDWEAWLAGIQRSGEVKAEKVWVGGPPEQGVAGRICVVRKTEEAIRQAQKRVRRRASKKGHRLRPETLRHAQYVMVFTTFPEASFPPVSVMQWYRLRWQIELVFKRFKSLAQLGHLPKRDEESSKAWLYGKLLVALLAEKLRSQARAFSPWGCLSVREPDAEPLA